MKTQKYYTGSGTKTHFSSTKQQAKYNALPILSFPTGRILFIWSTSLVPSSSGGRLIEVLLQKNSAYGLAIVAVRQRGGLGSARAFRNSVRCTIKTGAPSFSRYNFSAFGKSTGLLRKTNFPGIGECILLIQPDSNYDSMVAYTRARLITEKFLLLAIKDWLKKAGDC